MVVWIGGLDPSAFLKPSGEGTPLRSKPPSQPPILGEGLAKRLLLKLLTWGLFYERVWFAE